MSTLTHVPGTPWAATDPRQAIGRHHRIVPVEDRGRTTIAGRVIEAMAARIAAEEPDAGGAAPRLLGVAVGAEEIDRAPRVEAVIAGDVVSLRVRLSVSYPTPVRAVTERVRQRLTTRLAELTGKTVGPIDIDVAALHRPKVPAREIR